jgi:hypothetical protein
VKKLAPKNNKKDQNRTGDDSNNDSNNYTKIKVQGTD